MKHLLLMTTLLAGFATLCQAKRTTAVYQVTPQPRTMGTVKANPYQLTSSTAIIVKDAALNNEAGFLRQYVKEQTGITLADKGKGITLKLNKKIKGKEDYTLKVRTNGVTIEASTPAGIFYGVQFLRKSLPIEQSDTVSIPAVDVADGPSYQYRGMELDCGRHFFPVETVKKFLDVLALHNMNTFHWHLTEDQGWRMPVPGWPRLTEVGAYRDQTVIGQNAGIFDGQRYGGSYTRQEMEDVVAYAAKLHITVIPEIDMPGHMLSALASYPELGCTGGPYKVGQQWGVFDDILCAGKESTFKFVEDVLDEVMAIFPSTYIHLGGDEAPKTRWQKCPLCQKRIADEHLTAKNGHSKEDALQGYFMSRMEKYLAKHGRKMIGWDEILEGDVDTSACIMSWRGMEGGLIASKKGHDVIMTPGDYCYIDHYQLKNSPVLNIGGYLPLSKVYSFEPAPESLPQSAKDHIIGAQANLWTEYVYAPEMAFYQALPRLAALCEVTWTPAADKNYDNFLERLPLLEKFYKLLGVKYCKTIE